MRPLIRFPLRRPIQSFHSSAAARPRRTPEHTTLILGASLLVAGYVGWRIAGNDRRIALDAPLKRELPAPQPGTTGADAAILAPDPPTEPQHNTIKPAVASKEVFSTDHDADSGYPSGPSSPNAQVEPSTTKEGKNDSGGKEEEEEGEGAFNPITGEINWDCPCLGGMAHGPCGEQFREAFSCFVYSEQEPKGIDCVAKFKNMQDCFREHPDVYGEEIADDDEEDPTGPPPLDPAATNEPTETATAKPTPSNSSSHPLGEPSNKPLPQGNQ
ncbi:hypothetical protein K439DRAFT_1328544 [Ramaria rubella]|nr:hypothetical protein K439DRAFT_1328544 [Ramaria rubella]